MDEYGEMLPSKRYTELAELVVKHKMCYVSDCEKCDIDLNPKTNPLWRDEVKVGDTADLRSLRHGWHTVGVIHDINISVIVIKTKGSTEWAGNWGHRKYYPAEFIVLRRADTRIMKEMPRNPRAIAVVKLAEFNGRNGEVK